MTNPITADRRHFEDLALHEIITLSPVAVNKDMIITFAREFDPFPFHLDEAAAKASLLGGLATSGWQTGALTLRALVDAFLAKIAAAGPLGFSDLKWKTPLMMGDTLSGTATIVQLRRAATYPKLGVVTLALDARNQNQAPVMTMLLDNLVELRTP